jgi:hypothetical protein
MAQLLQAHSDGPNLILHEEGQWEKELLRSSRLWWRPSCLDNDLGFHVRFPFYPNHVFHVAIHFH